MDYIDDHAYWQHPHFPPPWDPKNWTMCQRGLGQQPRGTLGRWPARRVAGMPFTVSEYNHPQTG